MASTRYRLLELRRSEEACEEGAPAWATDCRCDSTPGMPSHSLDAEFVGADGSLELHIEVKTWPEEVERIATQIDDQAELGEFP